jgi:hypothetical protein
MRPLTSSPKLTETQRELLAMFVTPRATGARRIRSEGVTVNPRSNRSDGTARVERHSEWPKATTSPSERSEGQT